MISCLSLIHGFVVAYPNLVYFLRQISITVVCSSFNYLKRANFFDASRKIFSHFFWLKSVQGKGEANRDACNKKKEKWIRIHP